MQTYPLEILLGGSDLVKTAERAEPWQLNTSAEGNWKNHTVWKGRGLGYLVSNGFIYGNE